MIAFEDVHIGYDTALLEVTFDSLPNTGIFALIGANGSGKSTFLKTIAGLESPLKGSLTLDGAAISSIDPKTLAKTITYVPPRFQLQGHMKVEEFIALGRTPYLNLFGKLHESDIEQVNQAITTLSIDHLKNKFMHQLSDGEKQLCSLSRAFCQDTKVILLDEPTSFLDYRNKQLVFTAIQQIAAQGRLVIFSSHDLDMVAEMQIPCLCTNSQKQLIHLESTSKDNLIAFAFNS